MCCYTKDVKEVCYRRRLNHTDVGKDLVKVWPCKGSLMSGSSLSRIPALGVGGRVDYLLLDVS